MSAPPHGTSGPRSARGLGTGNPVRGNASCRLISPRAAVCAARRGVFGRPAEACAGPPQAPELSPGQRRSEVGEGGTSVWLKSCPFDRQFRRGRHESRGHPTAAPSGVLKPWARVPPSETRPLWRVSTQTGLGPAGGRGVACVQGGPGLPAQRRFHAAAEPPPVRHSPHPREAPRGSVRVSLGGLSRCSASGGLSADFRAPWSHSEALTGRGPDGL